MTEEEREALAGEYVIGTLPETERAEFERSLATDASLQALVQAWQERLSGLTDFIAGETPNPKTWSAIERALDRMTRRDLVSANPVPDYAGTSALTASVLPLRRSRARWRAATLAMSAIAAGLALFVASSLRPGIEASAGTSYLAVVNRGGELPALVVQVDTHAGIVKVRSLAAETPADRSLELWYIAPTGGAPRSLGLVDQPRRDAVIPTVARTGDLAGATLAVSVEPKGGSTTGGPSGPVIYSGKLVAE